MRWFVVSVVGLWASTALAATFEQLYLERGVYHEREIPRPRGPISTAAANRYLRKFRDPGLQSSVALPARPDDVLRTVLTLSNSEILRRLPTAQSFLAREFVVEAHLRRIPGRARPMLALIKAAKDPGVRAFTLAVLAKSSDADGNAAAKIIANASETDLVGLAALQLIRTRHPEALQVSKRWLQRAPRDRSFWWGVWLTRVRPQAILLTAVNGGVADEVAGLTALRKWEMDWNAELFAALARRNRAPINAYFSSLATNRKAYHRLKTRAIEGFRQVDSPRHVRALRDMLFDPYAVVRNAAASELVRRRDYEAIPLLKRALELPDEAARINGAAQTPAKELRAAILELERVAPKKSTSPAPR